MERILTALLALLIASTTLVSTALAEVITVNLETATYEEIVAACELLEAARVTRLKETFAATHEVQPADGITFRSVPWGSTRAETEGIIGAPYQCYDYMYKKYHTNSIYSDGRGIHTSYLGWNVAGYKTSYAIVNYVYPVLDGKLLRDDDLAVMCYCTYVFEDIGDVNALRDDLTRKLSLLYGAYSHGTNDSRTWTDERGNYICLTYGSSSVYLHYVHADADALVGTAAQAIADERAEQEELLRIQNQNNTDGL